MLLDGRVNLPYMMMHDMNECFQSAKSCLSCEAIMTAIFEAFDIPISDDDEIIKLKPIDIYNHSSLRYTIRGP